MGAPSDANRCVWDMAVPAVGLAWRIRPNTAIHPKWVDIRLDVLVVVCLMSRKCWRSMLKMMLFDCRWYEDGNIFDNSLCNKVWHQCSIDAISETWMAKWMFWKAVPIHLNEVSGWLEGDRGDQIFGIPWKQVSLRGQTLSRSHHARVNLSIEVIKVCWPCRRNGLVARISP